MSSQKPFDDFVDSLDLPEQPPTAAETKAATKLKAMLMYFVSLVLSVTMLLIAVMATQGAGDGVMAVIVGIAMIVGFLLLMVWVEVSVM